jgi:hypothetical protein
MEQETSKIPPAKNNQIEKEVPPCGCAIGDLLKVQEEILTPLSIEIPGDSKKQKPESELPACGCAIGDLLELQKENNTPGSGDASREK